MHRARLVTAALACSLAVALAGCGDQQSGDPVASAGSSADDSAPATAAGPGTLIPDDFPLSAGMGGPQDTIPTARTGTGLRDLELCGTSPLRGLGIRDRMVADNSGGESANTRELVLLGNPDETRLVADAFADLASDCDKPDARGGTETTTEVVASPFRPEPATTLVQTYTFDGEPGTGVTVVHVVPVGAALLVTSTYGQWTRDEAQQAVEQTVEPLRETVAAMEMFDDGTTPTEEPSGQPTAAPPPGVAIPEDFPLDAGMVEDGGDYDVTGPSSDDEGLGSVEMCGREVWPSAGSADGVARLATTALGPEYADRRELLVHGDAEQAVEAMAAVRSAAAGCRTSGNQVWTVLDRETGYDTVTVGLTYSDGLGASVFQVTRVGSARLMVQTYGEGTLASLDDDADLVTATTEKIVPAMCVFTKTGC
jgi:hypothetical protein